MQAAPSFERLDQIRRPELWGWLDALHDRPWTDRWGGVHRGHGIGTGLDAMLAAITAEGAPPRELTAPPAWIGHAVRDRVVSLSTTWSQNGGFDVVRTLERLGVPVEVDDVYVLAMVGGLGHRHDRTGRDAQLREDAVLRSRFWRVFEVEGGGEISLANIDKFSAPDAGWGASVLALAAEGVLERDRLLDSSLQALQRDFSAYRAGWFSRCFRNLNPSVEEVDARQRELRNLLRSPISATVSLAVDQLRRLSRHRLLEDDPEALRPGLRARTRSAAIGTITLFRDAGRHRPETIAVLTPMLSDALEHEHRDVQAAAIDLLESWNRLDAARAMAATLAPTMRKRLGLSPDPLAAPCAPEAPVPRRIRPRTEGLTERLAVLLEDDRDPELLEHTLADLARRPDPESFRPLTKRALHVLAAAAPDRTPHERLRSQIARLVLAGARAPVPSPPLALPAGRTAFVHRRIMEIDQVLADRRAPFRLLAEPTDQAGWLDPGEFAARFSENDPAPHDLIAAIHRLGPNDREEAAQSIEPSSESGRAARYALGAPAGRDPIRNRELWAAAAHTRAPSAEHPLVIEAGFDRAGQGRPLHTGFTKAGTRRSGTHNGRPYAFTLWTYRIDVDDAAPATSTFLTDGISSRSSSGELIEGWLDWLCYSSPADLEPLLTERIWPLFDGSVNHDAGRLLRGLLRHPGALGTLGTIATARGLVSGFDEHRVLAVDVATEHAVAGTLDAAGFARAITTLLETAPAPRWARALRAVSQAAPPGFIVDTLEEALPHWDPAMRGLADITSLYRDLLLIERRQTHGAPREWLGRISGSTRIATDARAILAL